MRRHSKLLTAIRIASLLPSSHLSAQSTLLHQWNWNTTVSADFNKASGGTVGTGVASGLGQSAPATPLSSIITNGAASDPGTLSGATTYNRAATVNPPLTSTTNASVGIQFSAPTTGMDAGEAVQISFSMSAGFRSSRYWQLLVSTTGTTGVGGVFSAPTGGIGSSVSQSITGMNAAGGALSGTATVNVSSTGVIDFRTLDTLSLNPAQITTTINPANFATGFVDNITFTLPTGMGYENNPSFAVALVGLWDPSLNAPNGTTGLLSSFAGTDSFDTTNGYNRSLASGGSMRLDLVSIYAVTSVPEPSTALLGVLAGSLALLRRRQRRVARAS